MSMWLLNVHTPGVVLLGLIVIAIIYEKLDHIPSSKIIVWACKHSPHSAHFNLLWWLCLATQLATTKLMLKLTSWHILIDCLKITYTDYLRDYSSLPHNRKKKVNCYWGWYNNNYYHNCDVSLLGCFVLALLIHVSIASHCILKWNLQAS